MQKRPRFDNWFLVLTSNCALHRAAYAFWASQLPNCTEAARLLLLTILTAHARLTPETFTTATFVSLRFGDPGKTQHFARFLSVTRPHLSCLFSSDIAAGGPPTATFPKVGRVISKFPSTRKCIENVNKCAWAVASRLSSNSSRSNLALTEHNRRGE